MFKYLHEPRVDLAKAVLRITLGFIFFAHGYIKLSQRLSWTDRLSPAMQQVVGWMEVSCGVLLMLGLLSQLAALGVFADMIGAIKLVTRERDFISVGVDPHGFTFRPGYEYNIIIMAVCVTLILIGSGRFSVDHLLFGRKRAPATVPPATASTQPRSEDAAAAPVAVEKG